MPDNDPVPVIQAGVLVIGAGPAGLSAGIEAASLGAQVLLIDDKDTPGGQLVKQTHMFFGSKQERAGTRGIQIARDLAAEFAQAGGTLLPHTIALGIYEDGFVGAVRNDTQYLRILPKKIIIATGAFENMLPFPGCDLPGVYGAGGFQTLMNQSGVLPGKRLLMVGAGNIGLIVAYQLLQAGGQVAAVVEAMPRIGGYSVHAAKIRRMGIPILLSHTVKTVHGGGTGVSPVNRDEGVPPSCPGRVQAATIVRLDTNFQEIPGSEFTLDVDSVCLSVGLSPLAELFFAAGCRMQYIPALGGHVPYHDEHMMTSNPDIFVAGDASGIEEASAAMVEGQIAGAAAAADLLDLDIDTRLDALKTRLHGLRGGPYGKKARLGKAQLWGLEPEAIPGEAVTGTSEASGVRQALAALSLPKGGDVPVTAPSDTGGADIPVCPAEPAPFSSGKRAVVECTDCIPCNPCEEACKAGAITIGPDISAAPVFHPELCTACGLCLTRCPGLAIFLVDMDYAPGQAEVTIPYEFLPLPKKGETWTALDRGGRPVGPAAITRVVSAKAFDKKSLVSFAVPKSLAHVARHIATPPSDTSDGSDLSDRSDRSDSAPAPDPDPIICRCEDVRRSTLEALIDQGYHTFDELKRITRVGMGPCQGKTCQRLILQMLAQKLRVPIAQLKPMTVRSPLKPVPFDTMANARLPEDTSENEG